jgi:exosortase/archaeosortase family protein
MTTFESTSGPIDWPLDSRRARLRFALMFVLTAAVLFSVYAFPYQEAGLSEGAFETYLGWYARAAAWLLGFFDPQVHVAGTLIAGRFPLQIVKNCDAIEINVLFTAAVVAFPAHAGRRWLGLLVGLPLLIALNLARICSLYYIGVHMPERFELFHMELWPLVLVGCTALIFFVYTRWAHAA